MAQPTSYEAPGRPGSQARGGSAVPVVGLPIDVAPGAGDSFSLEGSDGVHFVARLPASD